MTLTLPVDLAGIEEAASLLRRGCLVAFGTETVYGLGADATDGQAVAAIFAAKGRPRFNPLICHFPEADAAWEQVVPNDAARALARAFWPGPLSLVLPRRARCTIAMLAGAGLDTVAARVPAMPTTLALLRRVGRAVAAPSANRSGRISPTTAAHVLEELAGRIAAVLDGGPCPIGLESSVVDLTGPCPVLLRHGGITLEALRAVVEVVESTERGDGPADGGRHSPGLSLSHYAPGAALRINAATVEADEALLAFAAPLPGGGTVFQLSARADLPEAAARLFEGLRALDHATFRFGLRGIAAMPVPERGLGVAINDRLRRAASPR